MTIATSFVGTWEFRAIKITRVSLSIVTYHPTMCCHVGTSTLINEYLSISRPKVKAPVIDCYGLEDTIARELNWAFKLLDEIVTFGMRRAGFMNK